MIILSWFTWLYLWLVLIRIIKWHNHVLLISRLIQVSFGHLSILYWRPGSHTFLAASVMAKIGLTPLLPFDPRGNPSSLSQRWKIWTKHSQTYKAAMNLMNNKQEGTPTVSGRRSNTKNIRNIAWNWGRQCHSTSQTRWVFFSQEKCWLSSISIWSSSPAV